MNRRILVAYSAAANYVSTTSEYLSSFKDHANYEASYLHVTDNAEIDTDLNSFDVVFHSYCARLCFPGYASQSYLDALKAFRGIRVLAVQDEYERTDTIRQAIKELDFHIVLTCVPAESREFVYPAGMFPETEFVTVLTGYLPERLKTRRKRWTPLPERPIAIGYRGRPLRPYYGRLGFDKYEIGRRMREICVARGIRHDIETGEEQRIYGDAWYEFLGQCRTTLGTDSGSNVFDFDGSLEAKYRSLVAERGGDVGYEDFRRYTDPREHEIEMGQISPRIFEAAATGTPMVLFSGRYSGIISPDEHYIELKRDFSNIDAVLARIEDIDGLERLAERAFQHLVASGKYDYSQFVRTVEAAIERKREKLDTVGAIRAGWPDQRISLNGLDVGALTSLREVPTPTPRDAVHFRYKHLYLRLYLEHEALKREFSSETARLMGDIEFLRNELASETSRLTRNIEFLQNELASEASRLTKELTRLQKEFVSETSRLNKENELLRQKSEAKPIT